MLPKKEFNKILKALDNGTLKIRILSDEEYRQIEAAAKKRARYQQAKEPAVLTKT